MKHCTHCGLPVAPPGLPSSEEKLLLTGLREALNYPDARVDKIVIGKSIVAVLAGNRLGIASHLHAKAVAEEVDLVEKNRGKTCKQLAELLFSPHGLSVAVGLAACNAAINTDTAVVENRPIQQVVAESGKRGETALVGNFPFAGWLQENVASFHLFELQPVANRLPKDKWDAVLKQITTAAITSTVLITRYGSYYLPRLSHAFTVMIGPSTPLTPFFFEQGVDILAGSRVTDPERVIANMTKIDSYSQLSKAGGIEFVILKNN